MTDATLARFVEAHDALARLVRRTAATLRATYELHEDPQDSRDRAYLIDVALEAMEQGETVLDAFNRAHDHG